MTDPIFPLPGNAGRPAQSSTGPNWATGEPLLGERDLLPGGPATPTDEGRSLQDRHLLDPETEEILQRAPPWLISLIVHMVALILLGITYVSVKEQPAIQVDTVYGEQIGEQLLEESFNLPGSSAGPTEPTVDKQAFSPSDLPPVDDPFAAPPPALEVSPFGMFASSNITNAPIGLALTGREKGFKNTLLRHYGGNATTQDSVRKALEWLRRNQRSDGSWHLSGPFSDGSGDANPVAATALALLAFQGDGHTHREGEYRTTVKKGWTALLKLQDADGKFASTEMASIHQLYSHALATIAICELYGMTQDSEYRLPAERAIDYCVHAQDESGGGWRYTPRSDTDTSVTGWFVMALQSARMAKLDVPEDTLKKVSGYLDKAQAEYGGRYGYMPGAEPTLAMTAEGLLCRQYLGWKHDDPRLIEGVTYLAGNPIKYGETDDVYYWYYATQVMHHMEGKYWKGWNEVMRQLIPERQVKQGPEEGSWNPDSYKWGKQGGRLFVTCLNTFMLEVYYRHLPMYANLYDLSSGK